MSELMGLLNLVEWSLALLLCRFSLKLKSPRGRRGWLGCDHIRVRDQGRLT